MNKVRRFWVIDENSNYFGRAFDLRLQIQSGYLLKEVDTCDIFFYPHQVIEIKPFTPGPWKVGKAGSVVAENRYEDAPKGYDDVEYYGGYLICETIIPANARLVSAAPEMFEILKTFVTSMSQIELDELVDKAKAVIAKAEGWAE